MRTKLRHPLRLAMRTFYTATGFLAAVLTAGVAHDGLAPGGRILPSHTPLLWAAATCWALAVTLDGITYHRPHKGRP